MDDAPKGRRIDSAVAVERGFLNRQYGAFHLARTEREAEVIGSHLHASAPKVEFAATALVVIAVGTGCAELQEAQLYRTARSCGCASTAARTTRIATPPT
ncbi:hypothetical protein [Streptodolium elevatio]|uniref:Uncharacterized protein n=1 Tax=Streptodolium elevatio TaxID=3157996 RepID=A0ABV3DAL8_9ACTN